MVWPHRITVRICDVLLQCLNHLLSGKRLELEFTLGEGRVHVFQSGIDLERSTLRSDTMVAASRFDGQPVLFENLGLMPCEVPFESRHANLPMLDDFRTLIKLDR